MLKGDERKRKNKECSGKVKHKRLLIELQVCCITGKLDYTITPIRNRYCGLQATLFAMYIANWPARNSLQKGFRGRTIFNCSFSLIYRYWKIPIIRMNSLNDKFFHDIDVECGHKPLCSLWQRGFMSHIEQNRKEVILCVI